jgi:hypothetical protein
MERASLNTPYSKLTMRRRYEVWFLRFLLADGSGAWWLRYLLMNLGRGEGGCAGNPRGAPGQLWATWFPREGKPESFIQGFPRDAVAWSAQPFRVRIGGSEIGEDFCRGEVEAQGRRIAWNLRYCSTAGFSMTEVGWIGFSRSPHSDAVFSGKVTLDGRVFRGEPLGRGLQGHNSGFRHRKFWNWTHAIFVPSRFWTPVESGLQKPEPGETGASTFEALEYAIPFGRFRRALLWHRGQLTAFRKLETIRRRREAGAAVEWQFRCSGAQDGSRLEAFLTGPAVSAHRLPYLKTDCSGTFEVMNHSLATATLQVTRAGEPPEQLRTEGGAVLELAGEESGAA